MQKKKEISEKLEQIKNIILSYVNQKMNFNLNNILYLEQGYGVTLKTDENFKIRFTSFPFCKKQMISIRIFGRLDKKTLELDYYSLQNGYGFGTVSYEKFEIIFKNIGSKEKNPIILLLNCSKSQNEPDFDSLLKRLLQELKTIKPVNYDETLEEELERNYFGLSANTMQLSEDIDKKVEEYNDSYLIKEDNLGKIRTSTKRNIVFRKNGRIRVRKAF